MKDLDRAVERIERARRNRESVMIYGDYDVDGTTSVALMCAFLAQRGMSLEPYIPDRYREGYGLSFDGINLAEELGITLLIALDCGIKAVDQIAHARAKGIDVIVCDHHRPGDVLPPAYAILDAKQVDCPYPYKELSAAGVGFKLCQGLAEHWGLPWSSLEPLLDLVAISIAADIVPVTGENRLLSQLGLDRLRRGLGRPGLKVLMKRSVERPNLLTFRDISFGIAPKINAAGRIESGLRAVELLMSEDEEEQAELAEQIEAFNEERRSVQETIFKEAVTQIDTEQFPFSNVLFAPHWHKGVVGIVASKIVEERYRPTVVLTQSGEVLAGSVRSVHGFDVYEALEACEPHLIQFGGHKYAAGLTLHPEQLPGFKRAFEAYVREHLPEELQEPELVYDRVLRLEEVDEKFFNILRQFAPHGPENPIPLFRINGLVDAGATRRVGAGGKHLKIQVRHKMGGPSFSGIGFGLGRWEEALKSGAAVDVLAEIHENTFQGRTALELFVRDLQTATS